jgi:hypothetical protein
MRGFFHRLAAPSLILLSKYSYSYHENKGNQFQSSEYLENQKKRHHHRQVTIEKAVNDLLEDQELNIRMLPDFIEKRLYRATIRLTLDAIFNGICLLEGTELFGHHIILESQQIDNFILPKPETPFNRKPLHIFVKKLLSDDRVNVRWLPDSIEHQLYFNCLVLIFTVLQSFLGTTKIDLLGHSMIINMSPISVNYDELAARTLERRIGVSETIVDKLVEDLLARFKVN